MAKVLYVMCSNINDSDRTVDRSFRSVRKSKISIGLEESGEKKTRPLLKRVLERVRAEYKIRKTRRWLQRAITFVPNKILGWFKAVRLAMNLRFTRAAFPSDDPIHQPGLSVFGVSDYRSKGVDERPKVPFPFWWLRRGYDWLGRKVFFYGYAEDSPFTLVPSCFEPQQPEVWSRKGHSIKVDLPAEAHGGPHLERTVTYDDEHIPEYHYHVADRKETWGTQYLRPEIAQFDMPRIVNVYGETHSIPSARFDYHRAESYCPWFFVYITDETRLTLHG